MKLPWSEIGFWKWVFSLFKKDEPTETDDTEDTPPATKPEPQPEPPQKPSEYPSTTILIVSKANHDAKDGYQRVWLKSDIPDAVTSVAFKSESGVWEICSGIYSETEKCFRSMAMWWDFPPKYFVTCKAIAPHDMRTYKTQLVDRDGGEYNKPEVRPANMP